MNTNTIDELHGERLTTDELRFLLDKTEGQKAHGIFSMRRINKAVHEIVDMRNAWPEISKEMERLRFEVLLGHKMLSLIQEHSGCPLDSVGEDVREKHGDCQKGCWKCCVDAMSASGKETANA